MKRLVCKDSVKRICCVVMLLSIAEFAFADDTNDTNIDSQFQLIPQTLAPKAPKSAELVKHIDYPVSKYTGVPDISVPLYTINAGTLSIPISLNYHASGIKANQEATCVGLGWSMNVGGIITRTVVCEDDLGEFGGNDRAHGGFITTPTLRDSTVFDENKDFWWFDDGELRVDSEPDIFYFSIPGANGRFLFSVKDNGDIVPVLIDKEKANVKIEVLLNSCSFEIYDEGGNKYEFSSQEHTRTFYRSGPCYKEGDDEIIAGAGTNFTNGGYFNNGGQMFPNTNQKYYISSWYLSRIISQTNDTINFEYEEETYQLPVQESCNRYNIVSTTILSNNPSFGNILNGELPNHLYPQYTQTKTLIDSQKLKAISWKHGYIDFSYSDREDIQKYGSWPSSQKLDNIKILDTHNSTLHNYKFSYSYFNDGCMGTNKHVFKRLKLLNVCDVLQENAGYSFDYIQGTLPAKNSRNTDFWGYYNGANYKENYYSAAIVDGTIYEGAKKETNYSCMSIGTLNTITQPTGGKVRFEYEANSFFEADFVTYKKCKGDLRCFYGSYDDYNAIDNEYEDDMDSPDENLHNTSYCEEQADTVILTEKQNIKFYFDYSCVSVKDNGMYIEGNIGEPQFSIFQLNDDGTRTRIKNFYVEKLDYNNNWHTTENATIELPAGRYLFYACSREYNVECHFQYEYCEIDHIYNQYHDGGGLRIKKISSDNTISYTYDGGKRLILPTCSYFYGNNITDHLGRKKAVVVYLVQTSDCTHTLSTLKGGNTFGYDEVTETFGDGSSKIYSFHNETEIVDGNVYRHTNVDYSNGLLEGITCYDSNGVEVYEQAFSYNNVLSKDTVFAFYYLSQATYLIYYQYNVYWPVLSYTHTQTFHNGTNDWVEERLTSYDDKLRIVTDSVLMRNTGYSIHHKYASDVIPYMQNRNMISQLSETFMTKNGMVVKGKKIDYDFVYTSNDSIILPHRESLLETDNPLTLANYSQAFNVKVARSEYTAHGNPMQISTDAGHTVYLWGYKDTYPVAEIKNATFDVVKNLLGESFIRTLCNAAEPPIYHLQQLGKISNLLPDTQVKIFTYDPLKGLQSTIAPNKYAESYDYDNSGRLIRSKENGRTVSEYEYNYRKQ